jgi:hypothetical protein
MDTMGCQRFVRSLASPNDENKTAPFDSLRFAIVPRLNYWMDGKPGKRTLFIENEEETMLISFEEGMRCLDLLDIDKCSCMECRQGQRYLHLKRTPRGCVYFHMELPDETGEIRNLPGQMIVREHHVRAEEIEPILVELLNSITLVK